MACNYFCDGVDKAPQRSLFNALGMTKGRNGQTARWYRIFIQRDSSWSYEH